jgi:hypothetical protein
MGIPLARFTQIHVGISLVAIIAGLLSVYAMTRSRNLPAVTGLFLAATVLTSVTGFPIPPLTLDPPRIFGIISLIALAVALFALYGRALAGRWRVAYIVTATLALYLNCFVAVVQGFQKIPSLNALAPTGKEPPFLVAQAALLVLFVILGFQAARRYRPAPAKPG